MAISRKRKSVKKSSKVQKRTKNIKCGKSKTRKNIRKMRGGGVIDNCIKSSDCFDSYASKIIKAKMRDYMFEKHVDDKYEESYKSYLYNNLYKGKGYDSSRIWNISNDIKRLRSGVDVEPLLNNTIKIILEQYPKNL